MFDKVVASGRAKSYTNLILDAIGPTVYGNVYHKNNLISDVGSKTNPCPPDNSFKDPLYIQNVDMQYMTSENYHKLNVKNESFRRIPKSTSTIFCDLDDIAKRRSFINDQEVSASNANILKAMKLPLVNANPITVQECATEIRPRLLPKADLVIPVLKKTKKQYPQNDILSSEILLRDEHKGRFYSRNNNFYNLDITRNNPKVFNYTTKYVTGVMENTMEENPIKKQDKTRVENPCPCQLFTSACPCASTQSFSQITDNRVPVSDQVTSTVKMSRDLKRRKYKSKIETIKEDKLTSVALIVKKVDPSRGKLYKQENIATLHEQCDNNAIGMTTQTRKKLRRIICPNCKEKLDIGSTNDIESSVIKDEESLEYQSKELASTTAYNCSTSKLDKGENLDNGDVCHHEPKCELVPVCQILPADDIYVNPKYTKKRIAERKLGPRVIRITKACRHHPPCTVVPSCQRATVLRNNCEFIPPCLHRPRCINLPLCVPFSKSIHYDDSASKNGNEYETTDCTVPQYKYVSICRNDSLDNNFNQQCFEDYSYNKQVQRSALSRDETYSSFGQKVNQSKGVDCKCHSLDRIRSEAVVFIRDVGCQFYYKECYSKTNSYNSRSNESNSSSKLLSPRHLSRYVDKGTHPAIDVRSTSSISVISVQISAMHHATCPASQVQTINYGFSPTKNYVTAYVAADASIMSIIDEKKVNKSHGSKYREKLYPLKSRRSYIKRKYKKMFSSKRKRKSVDCFSMKSFATYKNKNY